MAVVDRVYTGIKAGESPYGQALDHSGRNPKELVVYAEVKAGDDNGSLYRLVTLSAQAKIVSINLANTAITGGTSYSLGLYNLGVGGGAPLDHLGVAVATAKEMFLKNKTMATARGIGAVINGLEEVPISKYGTSLLNQIDSSLNISPGYYDLVLTGNTVGSVDGTVMVTVRYLDI